MWRFTQPISFRPLRQAQNTHNACHRQNTESRGQITEPTIFALCVYGNSGIYCLCTAIKFYYALVSFGTFLAGDKLGACPRHRKWRRTICNCTERNGRPLSTLQSSTQTVQMEEAAAHTSRHDVRSVWGMRLDGCAAFVYPDDRFRAMESGWLWVEKNPFSSHSSSASIEFTHWTHSHTMPRVDSNSQLIFRVAPDK